MLVFRDPKAASKDMSHLRTVVEWRALTVALLDALADGLRQLIGYDALSAGKVLEGGTWAAGRGWPNAARTPRRRCKLLATARFFRSSLRTYGRCYDRRSPVSAAQADAAARGTISTKAFRELFNEIGICFATR